MRSEDITRHTRAVPFRVVLTDGIRALEPLPV